jgi:hypothetical protein
VGFEDPYGRRRGGKPPLVFRMPKLAWVAIIIAAFIFLVLFFGSCSSLNRPGPTQIAVVRNGGPFDSKDIREVRGCSSKYAISGLASEPRMYIAGNENRYYKVSSDPSLGNQSGADFIKVPTKDGVLVEVDAQITFRSNLTDESCNLTPGDDQYKYLAEKFDTVYGNRKFAAKDGDSHKVWEGNDGWNAFLDTIFRPVVENSFREQIGAVNCADLVSSCALVQSTNQEVSTTRNAEGVRVKSQDNRENFEAIQNEVQKQLATGVNSALGDEYLAGFKMQFTKVTLPKQVQAAIDTAQASFADIAKARAQKIQANFQAEANERLASAYLNNPSLAYIKAVETLKDSTATIILGEPGTGLTLGKR